MAITMANNHFVYLSNSISVGVWWNNRFDLDSTNLKFLVSILFFLGPKIFKLILLFFIFSYSQYCPFHSFRLIFIFFPPNFFKHIQIDLLLWERVNMGFSKKKKKAICIEIYFFFSPRKYFQQKWKKRRKISISIVPLIIGLRQRSDFISMLQSIPFACIRIGSRPRERKKKLNRNLSELNETEPNRI